MRMVAVETHRLRALGWRMMMRMKTARAATPATTTQMPKTSPAVKLSQSTHSLGSATDGRAFANALQPSGGTPRHVALAPPRQMRVAKAYSVRAPLLLGYASPFPRRSSSVRVETGQLPRKRANEIIA